MKILVLSNLYPPDVMGGYELACAQVVDALRVRGHDVAVLTACPRFPVPDAPHVHRRLRLIEDRYWVAPAEAREDALMRLRDVESRLIVSENVHALTSALRAFAPDVVYVCNLVGLGGLGLIACLQHLSVPWVWQLGDRIPSNLCSVGGRVIPALAREFSRSIRGHFVAVSRRLFESIEADGVRLNGPVEVAPNWITGERPPAHLPRPRGPTLRVMSSGRVNREKGVGILIEAAAALRSAGRRDFVVDIYGEIADPSFGPLIRRHGLEGIVALMGPRPHEALLRLYGEYDVLAFPSRAEEPFGLVVLEALAGGCVPVISRDCGVGEWLVHGVHCLKTARDAPSFAAVLARILDGEIPLGPIARRGSEAVWRDLHLDAILPRIERLLRAAARLPRPPSGTAADAFRLARLAEKVARAFVRDALPAPAVGVRPALTVPGAFD